MTEHAQTVETSDMSEVVETRFGHTVKLVDFKRINAEVMSLANQVFWDRGYVMSFDDMNSILDERFAAVAIH